jgi:hypothetical protein
MPGLHSRFEIAIFSVMYYTFGRHPFVFSIMQDLTFDRRLYARHKLTIQVDLVLANGDILPVDTCNISSEGMQFLCDSWVASAIEPRGIHIHTPERSNLKIVGHLPVASTSKLYARCRIISARRLSQHDYLIGLKFISFEGDGGKALEKLVHEYELRGVTREDATGS